jgi:hypothetical protein
LKKKPNDIYRSENCEQLKHLPIDLKSKCNDMESFSNVGEARIVEYHEEIRSKILVDCEILIGEIKPYREELIVKVNQHKKKCAEEFQKKNACIKKEPNNNFCLNETIRCFISQWSHYLKQFKIDEVRVKHGIEMARKNILKIDQEKKRVNVELFSGVDLIQFVKSKTKLEQKFGLIVHRFICFWLNLEQKNSIHLI